MKKRIIAEIIIQTAAETPIERDDELILRTEQSLNLHGQQSFNVDGIGLVIAHSCFHFKHVIGEIARPEDSDNDEWVDIKDGLPIVSMDPLIICQANDDGDCYYVLVWDNKKLRYKDNIGGIYEWNDFKAMFAKWKPVTPPTK